MPRITSEELVALQKHQEFIRNVCILAHVDHGKTTLSDSLVSSNGIISAKLAGKLRFLDSTEEEQQRGITMKSSAISLLHTKELRRRPGATATETAAAVTTPTSPTTVETTREAQPQQKEEPPPQLQDFLINLIDSPGHIDFSSDVSTATRLSDGAIVIVDVLEGVCTQTHAVLRQAWNERMKPCLVLNKLDRLILELRLTPLEAYWHLQRTLERVNAISSSLITSETFKLDETESFADNLEKEWLFAPERGNVVFASSLYCWAFSIPTFARIWAKKLGVKRGLLVRHLWGDFVFNSKTLGVSRYVQDSKAKPMFVSMILDPIWQLYEVTVLDEDLDKARKMIKRLDLDVPARELNPKDLRGTASAIFRRWLPLAQAVLDMVVDTVPDPVLAQHRRIGALWPAEPLPEIRSWSTHPDAEAEAEAEAAREKEKTLSKMMETVRKSVAVCSKEEEAPVVAFISKVMLVRAAELTGWTDAGAASGEGGGDGDVFVAFTRVFSGVLRPDSKLYVLGPKYHPQRKSTATHAQALFEPQGGEGGGQQQLGLFMMMGTSMFPVPSVPAGNLVAIAGLEGFVVKSATLSSTLACPALRAMTLQAKPIVRVAVEAVRQGDLDALEKGLARLYQADPAVEISVQENGEHVITALGELHLEQCIKDLRERYARVEVRASTPLVVFRESVALSTSADDTPDRPAQLSLPPWSEEEGVATSANGVCVIRTSAGDCRLTIRCMALPESLARVIDVEPYEVRKLLQKKIDGQEATEGQQEEEEEESEQVTASLRRLSIISNDGGGGGGNAGKSFEVQMEEFLSGNGQAAAESNGDGNNNNNSSNNTKGADKENGAGAGGGAKEVLTFGPRNVGPNLLLKAENFRVRTLWAGEEEGEGGGNNNNNNNSQAERENDHKDKAAAAAAGAMVEKEVEFSCGKEEVDEWKVSVAWPSLRNSVMVGFQMATASGPLAEEQMYGVAFVVEEVVLLLKPADRISKNEAEAGADDDGAATATTSSLPILSREDVDVWFTARLGSITGQVMSSCKSACRAAFLSSPVRLVEALFECDLQCDRMQLGKLYGVLSKRRGRVVEEDIIEGTDLFLIKALLPVAESFGFATELLKKTSGAATSPQLAFSHWERMEMDPFWRPRNEEDREEFGETVTGEINVARKYIDETRRRKGLQIGEKIVVHAEKQRTLSKKK